MNQKDISIPDMKLAATCGLFCPSCPLFIGTHEDSAKLEKSAEIFHCSADDLKCEGCRSNQKSVFCRENCNISVCAKNKGLEFCGECEKYPCEELKNFKKKMPNRLELWESQERIQEVGYEKWYLEMIKHYSCPDCGTINSVSDQACRRCGRTPGNEYVEEHREEILQFINHLKQP